MHLDSLIKCNLGLRNADSSDTNLTMKKNKRGGQNKHWAERLRMLVWYHEIKRRSGWTDYMLSYEFAWRDEALHLRSSTNRSWTFEWIRKGGRQVQGRDWRWRHMDEIVATVDQYSLFDFKGTEKLYRADLWDLIQKEAIRRPPDLSSK